MTLIQFAMPGAAGRVFPVIPETLMISLAGSTPVAQTVFGVMVVVEPAEVVSTPRFKVALPTAPFLLILIALAPVPSVVPAKV